MPGKVILKDYTEKIIMDIEKSDLLSRRNAAKYLARKMRKNIGGDAGSSPGAFPGRLTGNLRKGIGFKVAKNKNKDVVFGSRAPHSHLLEDGHQVTTKSGTINEGKKNEVAARPFFKKTFRQEKGPLIDIMSKRWF